MQAVFLLAGENKRFFPLNTIGQKSFFKLKGEYITDYTIQDLKSVGIKDFIFILSDSCMYIKNIYGSGKNLGISISYAIQHKPTGQGDAILQAEKFIRSPFIIVNPYHLYESDIYKKCIQLFKSKNVDAVLPIQFEKNIGEYSSVIVENSFIKKVVEKPKGHINSNYKLTSSFIFNSDFIKILKTIPSNKYSYEDAINTYCSNHKCLSFEIDPKRKLVSLKYPWQLLDAYNIIALQSKGFKAKSAMISKNVYIGEDVYIDENVKILEGACIKGRTYIGKSTIIGNNSFIRDSDIGENVVIGGNGEIARSIIMSEVNAHITGSYIGDSIIGPHSRLAAGFISANVRFDKKEIITKTQDNKNSPTHLKKLGVIMGKNVSAGIRVSTMPGVMISENTIIPPCEIIYKNI